MVFSRKPLSIAPFLYTSFSSSAASSALPSSSPLEDNSWVHVFKDPFQQSHNETMSLPAAYQDEINALSQEVARSQPEDIIQFCANYFSSRLESERIRFLDRDTPMPNANPFALDSMSAFPGTFGGASAFDGTRDAIREEEEEVQSPTAPSFKPQYNMGAAPSGGGGSRRNHSPGGGSTRRSASGSRRPRQGQASGQSSHLGPTGAAHLSPDSANGEFPPGYNRNRRTSVSAESLVPNAADDEWAPPVHPKTPEQEARLRTAVSKNFLFTHLDEEQFSQVLLALVEKLIPNKGMRVITQGDVGDYFYVVERGLFDVYVNPEGKMMPGAEGLGKKVASSGPGDSFGELALMYNAPRAATIVSTGAHNILWALDRVTFRRILMENTFKRRRMYEAFLEEVPVLSPLVASERSKIADSLDTHMYEPGVTIIQEGDPGDRFYFIESGEAEVYKSSVPGAPVRTLSKGDYFGELALLNDEPRAASIVAKTKVKVAYLGKGGFQRLLGPVADIMRRNDPRIGEGVNPLSSGGVFDESVDPFQQAAVGPHQAPRRGRAIEA